MGFQYCWEYRHCERPCKVRDTRTLFCWRPARTERFQYSESCLNCGYRDKWLNHEFSLKDFIQRSDRRRIPRPAKRVLVIDDEPNILYALSDTVLSEGYDCLPAVDGGEGLFLAFQLTPDLIISDVIMPRIDGYELCRILKSDTRTRQIPVMLVTVKGMEKEIDQGKEAGADDYLVKPFHAHDLFEKITSFLEPAL